MSKNDITGDRIITKSPSKAFDKGFDRIFKQPNPPSGMRVIYHWADGTWCDLEQYPFYTHMSDDVTQTQVPFDWDDLQIERHITAALSK